MAHSVNDFIGGGFDFSAMLTEVAEDGPVRKAQQVVKSQGYFTSIADVMTSTAASIMNFGFSAQSSSSLYGLEAELTEHAFSRVVVNQDSPFARFIRPNEGRPEGIAHHLAPMKEGLIVSTGSERSFFDLLLADETKCEGLVVRDVNPEIKAYVDFNVLLLRICTSMEEYQSLSCEINDGQDIVARLAVIKEKIKKSDMSQKAKQYYLNNLVDFGLVYLTIRKDWQKDDPFSKVWYHQDPAQFAKLQRYAKAGKIIATVGDINDLRFLEKRSIAVVDISNIHDYVFINIKGISNSNPVIIHTSVNYYQTAYTSCFFDPLSPEEELEFDALLEVFKESENITDPDALRSQWWNALQVHCLAHRRPSCLFFYSKNTLRIFKEFCDENILKDSRLGNFKMSVSLNSFSSIRKLTLEQVDLLCKNQDIKKFLPALVRGWVKIPPVHYLAFMQIDGWKEEFEILCKEEIYTLPYFLEKLKEYHLLTQFTTTFGQERLDKLEAVVNPMPPLPENPSH
jgi:hypothetical protein